MFAGEPDGERNLVQPVVRVKKIHQGFPRGPRTVDLGATRLSKRDGNLFCDLALELEDDDMTTPTPRGLFPVILSSVLLVAPTPVDGQTNDPISVGAALMPTYLMTVLPGGAARRLRRLDTP